MRNPFRPAAWGLALLALTLPGCLTVNLWEGGRKPLVETVVEGTKGPKILLLEVQGVLTETPEMEGFFGMERESTVDRIVEQLDKAREDDEVEAVLLRIDSPGGSVTASDVIYDEIQRFKRERKVPVVAQLMGTAASGGYYVAMAADEVVAHPTTITGSIGVVFFGVNISGLMEKFGVQDQTLVTGPYKDAGSPLRPMKPQERAQLMSVLDDLYARFVAVVEQGRPALGAERVTALADGRIYSAPQALELGLVDRIGDIREGIEQTRIRAGLTEARVVSYHRPREWRQNVYSQAPTGEIGVRPGPRLPARERPGFMYLWAPGAR
jgi:protease-4